MPTRPYEPADVVRLAPAATRSLGASLLVNVGGATTPVQALVGSGPQLYGAFAQGMSIAEAAASLAASIDQTVADIEDQAVEFAQRLTEMDLAEPAL